MKKRILRTPFFCVNPKSYLYGEDILSLAKACDVLSEKYNIDILFTCQHVDLYLISQKTKNLIVTAQHMDGHTPGRGMGRILPEGLKAAGVEATFLNHAENPMTLESLVNAIKRADELGIITIVCANSIAEAQTIATLNPDIMVCEPTELIGTGQVSDISYMRQTNQAIRKINENIYLIQAAGISTAEDVKKALDSGADGTGATSGIIKTEDPKGTVESMLEAIIQWRKEDNQNDF